MPRGQRQRERPNNGYGSMLLALQGAGYSARSLPPLPSLSPSLSLLENFLRWASDARAGEEDLCVGEGMGAEDEAVVSTG